MNVIVIIALVIVLIFLICIIMTIAATCISINKQWSVCMRLTKNAGIESVVGYKEREIND